ncbi:MAG TPA: hypothetical protein PLV62_14475, partial [Spirochaetota bacterium]|nr:hypothetical protein [Spirochaetota bacterium]
HCHSGLEPESQQSTEILNHVQDDFNTVIQDLSRNQNLLEALLSNHKKLYPHNFILSHMYTTTYLRSSIALFFNYI